MSNVDARSRQGMSVSAVVVLLGLLRFFWKATLLLNLRPSVEHQRPLKATLAVVNRLRV